MMTIEYSISIGNILTIATLLGLGVKYHRDWVRMAYQHGLMWRDYENRHGINGAKTMKANA